MWPEDKKGMKLPESGLQGRLSNMDCPHILCEAPSISPPPTPEGFSETSGFGSSFLVQTEQER